MEVFGEKLGGERLEMMGRRSLDSRRMLFSEDSGPLTLKKNQSAMVTVVDWWRLLMAPSGMRRQPDQRMRVGLRAV